MKKRGWIIFLIIVLILLAGAGYYYKFQYIQNFDVTPKYPVNLRLFPGSGASADIEVINNEKYPHKFSVYSSGLEGIISISETEFELQPKESKKINLILNDSRNDSHVSYGSLIVSNANFKKEIPIVLTFDDQKNLLAIIQKPIPKYDNVYPGGKLGMDIRIFDLGVKTFSKEIKTTYEIFSPAGRVFQAEELLVVNKEYSFSKIFEISPKLPHGNYVLVTSLEYDGIKTVSSYLFKIEARRSQLLSSSSNIIAIAILVFVVLFIILFTYFMKSRDELLLQLKKQQSKELERNLKLITSIQKKAPEKEKEKFEKTKKEVAKKIKERGEKQRKHVEKLIKRKAKKETIMSNIKKWENEGYKFPEVRKKIPEKSIGKKIEEWKKSGFDTSVLER